MCVCVFQIQNIPDPAQTCTAGFPPDKPVVHFVYCIHEIVVDSIVPIISIIIKYNARMKDRNEKFS